MRHLDHLLQVLSRFRLHGTHESTRETAGVKADGVHALIPIQTLNLVAKPYLGCMGMSVSLPSVWVASVARVVGVIVVLGQDGRGRMRSAGGSDNTHVDLVDGGGLQEQVLHQIENIEVREVVDGELRLNPILRKGSRNRANTCREALSVIVWNRDCCSDIQLDRTLYGKLGMGLTCVEHENVQPVSPAEEVLGSLFDAL